MAGWSVHEGLAVGLPVEGLDTDQVMPARFMKEPRAAGYGGFLLHDRRFGPDGAPLGSPLDDPGARGASILVTRRHFGGGSSREAAVYALADFGIRVVIAASFGDIFMGNAVNNGLLPARVSEADGETLLAALGQGPLPLRVELATARITAPGLDVPFRIDPAARLKLINGWDDIDLTARHADQIQAFRERRRQAAPWLWPAADPSIS